MKVNNEKLIQLALECGADRAAIIDVNKIVFSNELRQMCEQNSCGKYGTNWMCPPGVGTLDELKAKIDCYDKGLVLQTVKQLEDSFDFEGMMVAKEDIETALKKTLEKIKDKPQFEDVFPLGAGACSICKECTYLKGEKCRLPDIAFPSVEACGIDVKALVTCCDIPYYNGKDTVSYVGLILFKEE